MRGSKNKSGFPKPLLSKEIVDKDQQPVWVIFTDAKGVTSSWGLIDIDSKAKEIRIILPSLNIFIAPLTYNAHNLFADMGVLVFDRPIRPDENPYLTYS